MQMSNISLAQSQGGTVLVWGGNTYGQTNVAPDLTNVMAVASGSAYCLALRTNGAVVGWGYNVHREATPPLGLTNVVTISAATYHAMALKSDGTVVAWGDNDGYATNVPAGLTNVVSIAAGGYNGNEDFSLAVKSDGSVVGWGGYAFGGAQNIPAGLTNVVTISAGISEAVALKKDGTVIAWTYLGNSYGQTNLPNGLSNVVAIAAGGFHTLALKNDGTCVAWGANGSGQTNIPTGLSNVVAIASGPHGSIVSPDNGGYCMALKNDGTLVIWGSVTNQPVTNNVICLAAGWLQTMVITNNGAPAITVQPWSQKNYAGYSSFMFANAVGVQPITYQWQLNGTNIDGATNLLLNLTNIQPTDGGSYILVASNNFGTSASAVANLTVVTNIPPFKVQPTNQTIFAGFNASFSAAVDIGPIPNWFQWQFNGTNIIGATNSVLTMTNVQPSSQGNYAAIFSNNFGSIASSNAFLNIVTNTPALTMQPTNQTVIAGSNVTFAVATGSGPVPITYQWQFNGTNISWATNISLTLTNVQPPNQGNYDVVVSNNFGSVTSSNAFLTVVVIDLPTALNTTGLVWTNVGSTAWFAETNTSHDGFEAAQSGAVANGQSSALQTTVTGPGTLTYWWMFSPLTSPFPNTLSFSSSQGNASASVNSTTGWQQRTLYLGVGQQTLTWNYSRYSFASAQSTGWVDQVSFTPGGTPPTLTSMSPNVFVRANSSVIFSVGAYGTPPLAYQWQLNGTNLLNKTNTLLSLTGVQPTNTGIYSIIITNGFGAVITNAALWVGQFGLNTSATNLFMSTNGFQLKLDGVLTTNPVVIFGSTELVNWLPLFTNSATTGSVQFLDVAATNTPTRFYRAQE